MHFGVRSNKIDLAFKLSSSTSIFSSSESSEDNINPNWVYDTWELNSLIEIAKEKEINRFFSLREERTRKLQNLKSLSFESKWYQRDKIKVPLEKETIQEDSVIILRKRSKSVSPRNVLTRPRKLTETNSAIFPKRKSPTIPIKRSKSKRWKRKLRFSKKKY